jgi:hypothetical protein
MNQQQNKFLLYVDNCSAHPSIDNLKSINLQFLPPNTTSKLQPMDQGIMGLRPGRAKLKTIILVFAASP